MLVYPDNHISPDLDPVLTLNFLQDHTYRYIGVQTVLAVRSVIVRKNSTFELSGWLFSYVNIRQFLGSM